MPKEAQNSALFRDANSFRYSFSVNFKYGNEVVLYSDTKEPFEEIQTNFYSSEYGGAQFISEVGGVFTFKYEDILYTTLLENPFVGMTREEIEATNSDVPPNWPFSPESR